MFDDLSFALWVHVVAAIAAMLAGAALFVLPKGTARHRTLGTAYILALALVVISAAFAPATFLPFGGTRIGFFHVFVAIGAVALAFALRALRRWRRTRDPEALRAHQIHFAYSYTGLLMAGVSQFATNERFGLVSPGGMAEFWISFLAVNLLLYAAAALLIQTRLAKGDPLRFRRR